MIMLKVKSDVTVLQYILIIVSFQLSYKCINLSNRIWLVYTYKLYSY